MQDTKYNGWTNYATWRVNLEMFDGCDSTWTAESAKEFVEEVIYSTTEEGVARDYALAFLSDVNWHEIAEHYQDEDEYQDTDDDTYDEWGVNTKNTFTTSPEAYRCLQELKRTREAMQALINEVYAVLAENHATLRETPKLERLESTITVYEEFLQ
jgi:hypothetical protein